MTCVFCYNPYHQANKQSRSPQRWRLHAIISLTKNTWNLHIKNERTGIMVIFRKSSLRLSFSKNVRFTHKGKTVSHRDNVYSKSQDIRTCVLPQAKFINFFLKLDLKLFPTTFVNFKQFFLESSFRCVTSTLYTL